MLIKLGKEWRILIEKSLLKRHPYARNEIYILLYLEISSFSWLFNCTLRKMQTKSCRNIIIVSYIYYYRYTYISSYLILCLCSYCFLVASFHKFFTPLKFVYFFEYSSCEFIILDPQQYLNYYGTFQIMPVTT